MSTDALTPRHHIATDTETGGLYPSLHALLSIGAVCSWEPRETFGIYILPEPGKIITPEAIAKNGYTPELWEQSGAVTLAEAMTAYCSWLAARLAEQPEARMLAHGTAFDRGFLEEAARLTGHTLPGRHSWRDSMTLFGEVMDLGLVPHGPASLERLGELSGYWPAGQRPAVHDPLDDSIACLEGHTWLTAQIRQQDTILRELYLAALTDRRRLENLLLLDFKPENRGATLIANERTRQMLVEGYTPEADDRYTEGEFIRAASAYTWAVWQRMQGHEVTTVPTGWPWAPEDFKPRCDQRDLIRAAALLSAEVDRIERLEARKAQALTETPATSTRRPNHE